MRTKEEVNAYQREYYKKKKKEVGQYYNITRKIYYENHKKEYATRSRKWYSDAANKMRRRQKIHSIDFDILLENQNGLCALGGEPLPQNVSEIHVDHDHETGIIRGLLCKSHNVGLGMFNDDCELLEKAIDYIKKAKERAK